MPVDLIPDFIPVPGYLDDLVLVPLGIWLCRILIPKAVEVNRARAEVWLAGDPAKHKSMLGLAAILAAWAPWAWLLWRWLAPRN
ncbi:YkvA family protein [Paraburkholderia hospita]|uniref:YkvA family protein n=1 Tax=Paraburkholderia hospita TaxID=169430 RepID=UPI003BF9C489